LLDLLLTLLAPLTAAAQPTGRVLRIGELSPIPPEGGSGQPPKIFRQGLRELGWIEGENIVIEKRYAAGSDDRLREYAAELVRLNVDVIFAVGSSAVRVIRSATKKIPIVALDLESDPIASGLVAGLARPGGNLTGFFLDLPQLSGKRLELLKETIPGISRVAVLWDPPMDPVPLRASEAAARSLNLHLQVVEARGPNDFERAFSLAAKGNRALVVSQSPMFDVHQQLLVDLAAKHRLPTTSIFSRAAEAGFLMSYGPNIDDLFRQAAPTWTRFSRVRTQGTCRCSGPRGLTLSSTSRRPRHWR
jgi:putative ABC transport system substrate-binding protein